MASIGLYEVRELRLDLENPRLPESVRGTDEPTVLRYLFENDVLDELAVSFLDNGMFPHEPLLISEEKHDGRHIVYEGNRRLACLMVLRGHSIAAEFSFADLSPTEEQLSRLDKVPCLPIASREEVHRFLGFRHIGGLKKWGPEAKARYLLSEIERCAEQGSPNPFRDVGRRVGSNAQGVRNPYIAIKALRAARDDFGLDVHYIQYERFGVWQRCMNSAEIREKIGLGSPRTFEEVQVAIPHLNENSLRMVLEDLTPQQGQRQALLRDSRFVTDYGRVLFNKRALAALRKHHDLSVALQVINEEELGLRLRRLADSCRVVVEELHVAEVTEDLVDAADELFGVARSIRDIVRSRDGRD